MQDSYGYCAYVGSVSATLQQDGNSLSGSYVFTVTSAKPTGRLEGLESCSLDPYSGNVQGTVDGTLVILHDSSGLGFSGSATSDMMTLNFSDSYVIGTAKLQKFASFSQPGTTQPSEQSVNEMVQTGLSYLNEKRFDKALEYFNKIIAKDPSNVLGWMGKGVSYVGLKNYDQAITYFKKSLEMSPNNKDILRWLGIAYHMKGDCKTSVDYYSAALKIDPQNTKFLAEKKISDECLAKQIASKPPPSPKPETKPTPKPEKKPEVKPETTPATPVKLDYASVKSALDNIENPETKAQKALEILNRLPSGPIPEELRDILAHAIYGDAWLDAQNRALYVKVLEDSTDGAVATITPNVKLFNKNPVYFVNGIDNTLEESTRSAQLLAYMLERPVTRIYNKSDGLMDFVESGGLKVGLLKDNPSVQSLVNSIMSDLRQGKPVEIHAHSEGALITSVALGIIQEKNPEFFAANAYKITVDTYAGASWTYPKGPVYHHMTFATDIVPELAGRTELKENIVDPTGSGKFMRYLKLGKEIHPFEGHVDSIPRFIINAHLSDVNPREGIGQDLATRNPNLVSQTLKELAFGHDEVAYYYVKNTNDATLKSLPKSLLTDLKKYLESGSKEYNAYSLNKVNQALGVK